MADEAARIPKLVPGADSARRPDLDVSDTLILSQVDGASDDRALSSALGVELADVQAALLRLRSLGLITLDAAGGGSSTGATASNGEDGVELEPEHQRRILDLHEKLEIADHYALLGVPRGADKKAIKRAYYELAGVVHPDKYFRKQLGGFKLKMEAIFGRATLAHDVLTDKERRAEYDAYLGDCARTNDIESLLRDALAEVERAEAVVATEVSTPLADIPATPAPSPVPTPSGSTPALSAAAADARKAVLAKRLLGQRAPPVRPSQPSMPKVTPGPHASADDAMAALRRRYEDRVTQAKRAQAQKYADNATAALAQERSDRRGQRAARRGIPAPARRRPEASPRRDPESRGHRAHRELRAPGDVRGQVPALGGRGQVVGQGGFVQARRRARP